MKVAFCIKYFDGNPRFSDTFGNSDKFLIYDVESEKLFDKFTNHFKTSSASEIFCAQVLIKRGIDTVVCGKFETNAKNLFNEANIQLIENIKLRPTDFINELYTNYKQSKNITV